MFLWNNISVKGNVKRHENFFLLFREHNYVQDARNVKMVLNFIGNSHTFRLLFWYFLCLSKSLRNDFLCKVNFADFKGAI